MNSSLPPTFPLAHKHPELLIPGCVAVLVKHRVRAPACVAKVVDHPRLVPHLLRVQRQLVVVTERRRVVRRLTLVTTRAKDVHSTPVVVAPDVRGAAN